MDVRLKELPYSYKGKIYKLRCNMAVLADVQEASGGRIADAFSGRRGMKTALMFLAAMMTDYADEAGYLDEDGMPETFSWRVLGRVLRTEEVPMEQIMSLAVNALARVRETDAGEAEGEPEGN